MSGKRKLKAAKEVEEEEATTSKGGSQEDKLKERQERLKQLRIRQVV